MRRCSYIILRLVALAVFGSLCFFWGRQQSSWASLDSDLDEINRYLSLEDLDSDDDIDDTFSALAGGNKDEELQAFHRTMQHRMVHHQKIPKNSLPRAFRDLKKKNISNSTSKTSVVADTKKVVPPSQEEKTERARYASLLNAVGGKTVLKGFVKKTAFPHDHAKSKQLCVWVSDKYKFIGVKFAKTGGSTITKVLKGSFCGIFYSKAFNSSPQTVCKDTNVLNHGQNNNNNSFSFTNGKAVYPTCDRNLPPRWKWQDYFVFSFVRNPFSRRASMVKYCMDGTVCNACKEEGCGRCSKQHCNEMAGNVASPTDESYVDYVGHTETMQSDLNVILSEVERRYQKSTGKGINWTNKTDMTSLWENKAKSGKIHGDTSFEAFAKCPGCVEHISKLYARDVALFGFEPPL